MKREGYLIERVADLDNLLLAFHKAHKGKLCKNEVRSFRADLQANLMRMRDDLLQGVIDVGNYHTFTIFDPKQRLICAAAFSERVLHHALMQVCHPVFERHLICHTYATRLGKGTYAALDYAHHCSSRFRYVAKLDVRKYFDSIDHQVLKKQLARLFKDGRLLHVLHRIIDTYEAGIELDERSSGRGLPIGNLTSQYFANLYLSGLDHHSTEQLHAAAYVRYMDDILVFGNYRSVLVQQVEAIRSYAAERLHLELKPPLLVSTSQGVSFLGYRLQGYRIGLNSRSRNRLRHKSGVYAGLLDAGCWTGTEYRDHITPLYAFAEHAYSKKTRQRIITQVESRRAPTASIAAAAGTTTPGTAACRTATTTTRRTATTTLGSGLSWSPSLATADGVGTVNRLSSCFCHGQNETSGCVPHKEVLLVDGMDVSDEDCTSFKRLNNA